MLLVYGDSDKVVPHKENSELLYERYKALGGPVERIVKPGADHHPHGLTDPKPIVEFFQPMFVGSWQLGPPSSCQATHTSPATIETGPSAVSTPAPCTGRTSTPYHSWTWRQTSAPACRSLCPAICVN
jgi:hypothetical protein